MNIFKQIAQATGESVEAVCQMQEEERNQLILVFGIQPESRETKEETKEDSEEPSNSKGGGRKRKALQTFLSEKPSKKLNRNTTDEVEGICLKSSSRATARKAKLKVSEISKILDSHNDADTSNDPDQKIEDFDDFDLISNTADGKRDDEVTSDQDTANIFLNLNLKCPDLLKLVRKAEDILKEDLPELNLNEARRPKFEEGEGEGERHRRAVKSLTSYGLTHNKVTRRSWVKVKIIKNKPRTLNVTKDDTLEGRKSEEDDETGLLNGVKDEMKKLNIQNENKNLLDDEDQPIIPTSSGSTFKIRKRPNKPQQRKKSFDFIDEDEKEFDPATASRKTLYNKIKKAGNVVKQSLAKSDDEIQFVKEVKSPQNPQAPRRPMRKASCEGEEEMFPNKGKVVCPLCNLYFSQGDVEDHAATCGAEG